MIEEGVYRNLSSDRRTSKTEDFFMKFRGKREEFLKFIDDNMPKSHTISTRAGAYNVYNAKQVTESLTFLKNVILYLFETSNDLLNVKEGLEKGIKSMATIEEIKNGQEAFGIAIGNMVDSQKTLIEWLEKEFSKIEEKITQLESKRDKDLEELLLKKFRKGELPEMVSRKEEEVPKKDEGHKKEKKPSRNVIDWSAAKPEDFKLDEKQKERYGRIKYYYKGLNPNGKKINKIMSNEENEEAKRRGLIA